MKSLIIFLALLMAFVAKSETDVQFTFASGQYDISQYTNVTVSLQMEKQNASGTITLLPGIKYLTTDTNASVTFSNLATSTTPIYYHWAILPFSNPSGTYPIPSIYNSGDIVITSTNAGLISATSVAAAWAPVYSGSGAAYTAQASDLRYATNGSTGGGGTNGTDTNAVQSIATAIVQTYAEQNFPTWIQATNFPVPITNNQPGVTLSGTFTGTFTGDGSALTGLNASSFSSGTVADARLSGNVVTNTRPDVTLGGFNLQTNGITDSGNGINLFMSYPTGFGLQDFNLYYYDDVGSPHKLADISSTYTSSFFPVADFDFVMPWGNPFWVGNTNTQYMQWWAGRLNLITTNGASAVWTNGDFTTSGTITAGNGFTGNGSGLTNLIHGTTLSSSDSSVTFSLTKNSDGSTNYDLSAIGSGGVSAATVTNIAGFVYSNNIPKPVIWDDDAGRWKAGWQTMVLAFALQKAGYINVLSMGCGLNQSATNYAAIAGASTFAAWYGAFKDTIFANTASTSYGSYYGTAGFLTNYFAVSKPSDLTNVIPVWRKILADSTEPITFLMTGNYDNLADLINSPADSISTLTGKELLITNKSIIVLNAGHLSGTGNNNITYTSSSNRSCLTNLPNNKIVWGFDDVANIADLADSTYWTNQLNPSSPLYVATAINGPQGGNNSWDDFVLLYTAFGTNSINGVQYFSEVEGSNYVNAATAANTWTPGPLSQYMVTNACSPSVFSNYCSTAIVNFKASPTAARGLALTPISSLQTGTNGYFFYSATNYVSGYIRLVGSINGTNQFELLFQTNAP